MAGARPPTPQPRCSSHEEPAAEMDDAATTSACDTRFVAVEPPSTEDRLYLFIIRVACACDVDVLEGWSGGLVHAQYQLPGLRDLCMGWLEPAPQEPDAPPTPPPPSSPPRTPRTSPPATPRALPPASPTSDASSTPAGSMRATAATAVDLHSRLCARATLLSFWEYACAQPLPVQLIDCSGRCLGHANLQLGVLLSGAEFEIFSRGHQTDDSFAAVAVVALSAADEGPVRYAHAGGGRRATLTVRVSIRCMPCSEWSRRGETAVLPTEGADAHTNNQQARVTRSGVRWRPSSLLFCSYKRIKMADKRKPAQDPKTEPTCCHGGRPQDEDLQLAADPKPGPSAEKPTRRTQQNKRASPAVAEPVVNDSPEAKSRTREAETGAEAKSPPKFSSNRCLRCDKHKRKCRCARARKSAIAERRQTLRNSSVEREEDEPCTALGLGTSKPETSSDFLKRVASKARKRSLLHSTNVKESPKNTVDDSTYSVTNSTEPAGKKSHALKNKCGPMGKRGRFRGRNKAGNTSAGPEN